MINASKTQKDAIDQQHLRFLRSRLKKGEQKEIASLVGASHGYVRLVLGGFEAAKSTLGQEIVRIAQNRVYSRAMALLLEEIKPVLPYRPDFIELVKEELEGFEPPFEPLSNPLSNPKIAQFQERL